MKLRPCVAEGVN